MKYDNSDKYINDIVASFKMDNIIIPVCLINEVKSNSKGKTLIKTREVPYGNKRRN